MAGLLKLAKLPRSTFYYQQQALQTADKYQQLRERICTLFERHKERYGYRRITAGLRQLGSQINHKTVQRLMGVLGLKSLVRPKKYRSFKGWNPIRLLPSRSNRPPHRRRAGQRFGRRSILNLSRNKNRIPRYRSRQAGWRASSSRRQPSRQRRAANARPSVGLHAHPPAGKKDHRSETPERQQRCGHAGNMDITRRSASSARAA
jgi:hypothetical protein